MAIGRRKVCYWFFCSSALLVEFWTPRWCTSKEICNDTDDLKYMLSPKLGRGQDTFGSESIKKQLWYIQT